ncbi:NAD(P)-dependent dehydrogenase, short-chain alcohol dehydrogenase family [Desulfacinum infernum DSM 9756]|uniref:NAD(P)-dependent dehydrogenase, short-chain alcohol dehydrogenase family n=1 Tax=Desulfacinum infernum DSM 9756 TaxID=1121391 RepID=A0A1M5AGS0_9BACT|nr:SDR family oxidoreductase [Desulfacinum infernum]SHF29449.1 NAD(P)-dependent dehydrogenase, short-chain alcohol dehydrogenase family [Desulfacinum infernum DSM 9756]
MHESEDPRKADPLFDLAGKVAVVTGGAGILCREMAFALAERGVGVAVMGRHGNKAEAVAEEIESRGGQAMGLEVDVLDKAGLLRAREAVLDRFGRVDILINGAGGNKKEATTSEELSFLDLPEDALRWVFDLNFLGTLLACQVFLDPMVRQGSGAVLNISSMAAFRPLTRTVAYSAAKAAVSNFTQWLAVHVSHHYSPRIRVNALAPGFILTEQNRYLLTDEETGKPTDRGRAILRSTPMGRYGTPEDLLGAVIWLVSDAAAFVTGAVIPVDGGFSAFSGV